MQHSGFGVRAGLAVTLSAASLLASAGIAAADATHTIKGSVFFDRNANGVRDTGEPGNHFAGLREDSVLINDENGFGRFAEVDAQGNFQLSGLADGRYTVWVRLPGFQYPKGNTPEVQVSGRDAVVNVGTKGNSFSGRAWLDRNADGIRQDDEPFQGGGTVIGFGLPDYYTHRERAELPIAADGTYRWEDVPDGAYHLRVAAPPAGHTFTKYRATEETDRGSQFAEADGSTRNFVVTTAESGRPVHHEFLNVGYRTK